MRILTLGHSTRTTRELVELLAAHGIAEVVDVRRFPMSRRHPHLGRERLAPELDRRSIAYTFEGEALGGRRTLPRESREHAGLRNASFRAYAHHMHTPAFAHGIERLLARAAQRPVAIMCAERFYGSCHRKLIADDLVALRGVEVLHVLDRERAVPHAMTPSARIDAGRLWYGPADAPPDQQHLFP